MTTLQTRTRPETRLAPPTPSRTYLRAMTISTQVPAEPGDTLGSVGYRNGDQCAFTYLGPAEEDLRPEFRAAEDVSVSSSDDEEDD